MTSFESMEKFY